MASREVEEDGHVERIMALKMSRAGVVGHMTRNYRNIETVMLHYDNRAEAVKIKEDLDMRFETLKCLNETLMSLLDNAEDRKDAETYFDNHQKGKVEFDEHFQEWIEAAEHHNSDQRPGLRDSDNESLRWRSKSLASARSVKSSHQRLKEAQVKEAVAKLKAIQLKVAHQLEREELELKQRRHSLELQNEIEQANLEAQIWVEEEMKQEPSPSKLRLNPKAEAWIPRTVPNDQPKMHIGPKDEAAGKEEVLTMILEQQRESKEMVKTIKQGFVLPKTELTAFSGDPLQYWNFFRMFENTIEANASTDAEKLTYILQYCTGKAKEVIQSCAVLDPSEGYREAKEILAERFGDPYVIAMAHVRKVTEGQPIKSTERGSLLDFSDTLRTCENTLRAIGYLEEINTADSLRRIVERLPFHLKGKWLTRSRKIRQAGGKPRINHLSEFVRECAEEANDPVFGSILESQKKDKGIVHQTRPRAATPKVITLATHVESGSNSAPKGTRPKNTEACPSCGGDHEMQDCKVFKSMPHPDRMDILRKHKMCHNCFKQGHFAVGCAAKPACTMEGCKRKHQTIIHSTPEQRDASPKDETAKPNDQNIHCNVIGAGGEPSQPSSTSNGRVLLQIVPVKVKGRGQEKEVRTYALLDSGSDVTLCDEDLVKRLGVSGIERSFLMTTQERKNSSKIGLEVELTVESLDGDAKIELPRVWAIQALNISESSIPREDDALKWPHLQDIELPGADEPRVRLLIGCNVPDAFMTSEERRGRKGEPHAAKTTLGWTVFGPANKITDSRCQVNLLQLKKAEENIPDSNRLLRNQLEKFWKTDFGDSLSDSKATLSVEDKRALEVLETSAKKVGGHYQLPLPWKPRPPCLPNNRFVAEKRLRHLKGRLQNDRELFAKYKATIEDYLCKGYAREVPGEELDKHAAGTVWYLPHHPVVHPRKPGKVRVVFDCAAKYQGTCLNDHLMQGPDLTNNLVGVLARFREEPVAVAADIEAMFHQVWVDPVDCNALRFLWWPDADLQQEPKEYQMLVHLFGATSSPTCSNFALQRTASENDQDFDADIVKTVQRNFYVDDCLKSVDTTDKAVEVARKTRELLARGGFNLTKWISNKKEVIEAIPEEHRAKSVVELKLDRLAVERTLGVRWDIQDDNFGFTSSLKEKPKTRRGILSAISTIYDPLGFIAPIILPAKKLMQDLTRQRLDWDSPILEGELSRWNQWSSDLSKLSEIAVNRCVKPEGFGKVKFAQLHHFADASQAAYCSVSYIRMVNTRDEAHCAFLFGKSRLAPLKTMTIPRLELSAAVLAVNANKMLVSELDFEIHESVFWTDSMTVLQYIENQQKRFHTFVANHLAIIHDGSDPAQWRYVNSNLNPADDATRGLTIDQLLHNYRWLRGPEFLWKAETNWPTRPDVLSSTLEGDPEVKREEHVNLVIGSQPEEAPLSRLIKRYSSWNTLKKAVAWLTRFKQYVAQKEKTPSGNLTPKEVQAAESDIIKFVQGRSFYDLIKALQTKGSSEDGRRRKRSLKTFGAIHKLNPVLDDGGLLRIGGRLKNAPIPYEARHPLILPYKHEVSNLIVMHYHEQTGHAGQDYVLSRVRENFWIVKGRTAVRRVLAGCLNCRRRNKASGEQIMADLPRDRITPDEPPFTNVEVDFFGPLFVRHGRGKAKRYGCLFTCLAVRAVHIEIAHSLETDSFINALRRFICRRGCPSVIRSDNGTNFVGAERELREAVQGWNQRKISDWLVQKNVTWMFNPPSASHMGGVWERQIRSARKILKSLADEKLLTDETLLTLVSKTEAIINGRPLTPISDDPKDMESLTPNHILFPVSSFLIPVHSSFFSTFWLLRNFYSCDAHHANYGKHSLNNHFQQCPHSVYEMYSVLKLFKIVVCFAHLAFTKFLLW